MLKECRYIPTLETDRLILRKLEPEDAEDLKKWLGRDEVYTYWGRPATKGEKNPELLFIDPRPNVKRRPSDDFVWGIEMKETHEVVGIIEVFDVENRRSGMVGYRIDPRLWNRGLCTEAMRRVVGFIFSETEMDRLQGNVHVDNIGSNRVLEKSGFRLEGTIRRGKMVSEYCDYNIWGILREDRTAAEAREKPVTVGEVCLMTNDVPRLAAFYKRLLGADNGCEDAVHQFILTEGTALAVYNDGTEKPGRNRSICLAFTVEDIIAAYEKVKALGAAIIEPPAERPWGAVNMSFYDPDGNVIYLRSFPAR